MTNVGPARFEVPNYKCIFNSLEKCDFPYIVLLLVVVYSKSRSRIAFAYHGDRSQLVLFIKRTSSHCTIKRTRHRMTRKGFTFEQQYFNC